MKKLYIFILVFLFILAVYLFTAHPSIPPYRDSGDLVSSGYTLSIAHPPGYPLYTITGKIFTVIFPFANIAYRVDLVSIVFGALAATLTGCFACLLSMPVTIGIICSFLLAFSGAFWSLAHVSEMYTLSAFFTVLIFILLLRARQKDTDNAEISGYFLLSFIFGLGLGSHPTVVFILPGILWYIFKHKKHLPVNFNNILLLTVTAFIGFSVYFFLMIRSATNPILDWGNPETLQNLIKVITRSDYGGLKLHPEQSTFIWSFKSVTQQNFLFIQALSGQFTLAGLLLGLAGIYFSFRNKEFKFLFPGFIFTGIMFFLLANLPVKEKTTLPILEPNLVTPNLIFAIFAGYALTSIFKNKLKLFLPLLFILPLFLLAINFHNQNKRTEYFAYDYGKNLLFTMEKDSIIYDPDDATAFILSYLRLCENKRRDVKPVMYFRTRWGYEFLKQAYPEILPGRDIPNAKELIETIFTYNLGKRKIYTDVATKIPQGLQGFPVGLLYEMNTPPMTAQFEKSEKYFSVYTMRGSYNTALYNDFFTQRIMYYYAAAHNNIGLEYVNASQKTPQAQQHYKTALFIKPDLSESLNNLGSLAFRSKDFKTASEYFSKALSIFPEDPALLYNLSLSCKNAGNSRDAEIYLNKAVNLNYIPAINETGLQALNSGNYAVAISIFENIISKDPGYSYGYYNLALSYQQAGNTEMAERNYRNYLQFTRDPGEIKDVESKIHLLKK